MRWIDPLSGSVIIREKLCSKCRKVKPTTQFPWLKRLGIPHCHCCECEAARLRAWRAKRAAKRGIRSNKTPQHIIEELAGYIELGLSAIEAAQKMGRSKEGVRELRRYYCLPKFKVRSVTCP